MRIAGSPMGMRVSPARGLCAWRARPELHKKEACDESLKFLANARSQVAVSDVGAGELLERLEDL